MPRFSSILILAAGAAAACLILPSRATAQVEIEVDPLAYALNGFSLHLAQTVGPLRLNVGTFGIDVPEFAHGNEGWSQTMRGVGLKVDWLGDSHDGFFAGVEGGVMRMRHTLDTTDGHEMRTVIGMGVRGGYRAFIGTRGFYVAPWIGLGYNLLGDPVEVGGQEFERSAFTPFPTVHLGWRF